LVAVSGGKKQFYRLVVVFLLYIHFSVHNEEVEGISGLEIDTCIPIGEFLLKRDDIHLM
jgi:hypothetical protein